MLEFFRQLFATDFMPHAYCLNRPEVLWLHVASDMSIALAYYSIPALLLYFISKRRDMAFHWMFLLFGLFIMACGTTHLLNVYTLWTPVYRLEGLVKALTAGASVITALLLIPVIPRALALPRPADLQAANEALSREVRERQQAEATIRELNADLERRVAERTAELQRSNEDLQQFAYIASHDLQEPLRMVASYTQLLGRRYRGQLDPEADEYIGFAVEGAFRMQAMISDLLAYSRLDAELHPSALADSEAALQEALQNLTDTVVREGADISATPLPPVAVLPSHLVQLFQNLLSNAIKYRGDAPPRVRISHTVEGRRCVFCVADNGVGINPEYFDQIFVLFKRLHSRQYSGTGIGLALCKRIVLRYGGRIWVESQVGQGSRFFFSLPLTL